MHMTKRIWTAISAAKELGISKRHLYRHLRACQIEPTQVERTHSSGGNKQFFLIGVSDLEKLRESLKHGLV